ncbi:MAG: leucyl aminopeptidase [Myxococcota bacterium]|jgi:leucyl aminopeptidase
MSSDTLKIRLWSTADFPAEQGREVKAIKPFQARLQLAEGEVQLDISVPDLSRAELRWGTDKVVRKALGAFRLGKCTISAGPGVADDSLLTIALDQHHAFRGKLTVVDNQAVADRLAIIGKAEDGYRAWVNEDATTRTSLAIAADVVAYAADQGNVSVEVMEEDALREHGLNLLLAVGGASTISPPRLVIARYTPEGKTDNTLMLLGKGITFDTGGINVKPYLSHVSQMKNDMAGSALAWWLFRALVDQGYDRPVLLVLATCENPIGENAMRPGTVVKSYRGHTVRIDHTDAEGRLALADGLAYAVDTYQPAEVISFATLTTAALIAYGPYATPVHFPTPEWQSTLEAASERTGEDLHFFPQRLWHFESNRDLEANLKNTARLPGKASSAAGSRNAAHFLKHFAADTQIMHLDIFASTWNWAGDAPGSGYGATGAPMRTLIEALL